jgi:DNA-binding CsgD family transcriptional regulator
VTRPPRIAERGVRAETVPAHTRWQPAVRAHPDASRAAIPRSLAVDGSGQVSHSLRIVSGSRRGPSPPLRGRRRECDALDRLVADMREGRSQVLVLRGEAGVGKSSLLDHLARSASGCRVARASGVESEMELAFAGLHLLCAPFLDRLERLPAPQREALSTGFGLQSGRPPDRFLVGLAALRLLADVAEAAPLVCLVDDAQWLDRLSAQTLAFVARRLLAERVTLVFAVREAGGGDELAGLPELPVGGLLDDDARALLDSVTAGSLDEATRDRLVRETRGIPLALLELPRWLTPAELEFGFGSAGAMPLTSRIEDRYLRELAALPVETRRLLLVAALDPVGDLVSLWQAAERLGIRPDAATPAEARGLVELSAPARFCHPLVRSALCRAASPAELREVHQALADVTDPVRDADRRAWHRAHATDAPDEAVAEELERAATRAQARGGTFAAVAFWERAIALTPDPALRGGRALAAAETNFDISAPRHALALLGIAEACPLEEVQRARLERLRARVLTSLRSWDDLPAAYLRAARRFAPLDGDAARETILEGFAQAMYAGRIPGGPSLAQIAEGALEMLPAATSRNPVNDLVDAAVIRCTGGYAAGVPALRRALAAGTASETTLVFFRFAVPAACDIWDLTAWNQLTALMVQQARRSGVLTVLPMALNYRASFEIHTGRFDAATAALDDAEAIMSVIGTRTIALAALELAAWQGDADRALPLIAATADEAAAMGNGRVVTLAAYARATLYNGLGRYHEAFDAARDACAHEDLGWFGLALGELVEAAVHIGELDVAHDAVRRLEARTSAAGTDWALGAELHARALVATGDDADRCYREAVAMLDRTGLAVHRARAQLGYGEWLRRGGRRVDAREQLRASHMAFAGIGAEAFAERARRELVATGETVRSRTVTTRFELTPQEAQIARLARERRTNTEIAAELYLSPRTVEWHLRKVFTKLGVTSRRELSEALAGEAAASR